MIRTQLRRAHTAGFQILASVFALAIGLALAPSASADRMNIPSGDVIVTIAGVNPETQQGRTARWDVDVQSDGSFALSDASSQGANWTLTDLDVSGNVDPFTSLNYAVTNNAAVPLLFTMSVTLPISPQGPSTLHGGSFGATLTDANNNGSATVSTAGGLPLYRGQIDGTTVLSIYPDPYSLSTTFAGQSINVPAMNVGLPGPTLPSGAAASTITIINQFMLSPGDIFSGNSFFVIEAVPEPGTLALAAACSSIALLVARARRRA
jgi:hypothetical protein